MSIRERRLRALQRQIDRLQRRQLALQATSDRLSRLRLATFGLLLLIGAVVLLAWGAVPWAISLLLLVSPFALTVRGHRQVEDALLRNGIWQRFKEQQLARMNLDWINVPALLAEPVAEHPFAHDLDLTGQFSLQHLLDVAITAEGCARLGDWLLETEPDPERTRWRQALVRELAHMPALATRLALQATLAAGPQPAPAGGTDGRWSGQRLISWLQTPQGTDSLRRVLQLLAVVAPINLVLLGGFLFWDWPPYWLLSALVYGVLVLSQSARVAPLFQDAATVSSSLRQLAAMFSYLEEQRFPRQPQLKELCRLLHEKGARPSEQLAHANRLLAAAGLRYNPALALLLNALVPWDVYFAYRLAALRNKLGTTLPGWLDLWYTLEALNGLANFGFLYPEATYAQILPLPPRASATNNLGEEGPAGVYFCATGLGHPLVAAAQRVTNDFKVAQLGVVTLITGSNMAGKSTFLRTLGINICLAQAGAPVLAQQLELVPWRLVASITITDSITHGFSFFYAEVRRLKFLLDELQRPHPFPLFFLVDEIFRGTNNRERLAGSRAYLEAVAGQYGVGVVATHDLELVSLAENRPGIRNFHFRDDVRDGRMVFDYKLHPGPCPTTNALRIMRLAGLPVSADTGE